jgi:hypothetical protein
MSPSTAGALGSPSLFSGVSLVMTRNVEAPGGCGPGVFTAEEHDGIGNKGSGCKTSGLGTIFHNCQSIKISGVTASGLKNFHCNNKN